MILDISVFNIKRKLDQGTTLSEIYEELRENYQKASLTNCLVFEDFENFADKAIKNQTVLINKPLLGLPVIIKDNIVTQGMKTQAASKILDGFIPPYDATAVTKIRENGGIILGKANLDEFGMGSKNLNSCHGPCLNPWNLKFTPGGSSGGSAVSVALRLCPVALGSDTGGSVRLPASFCGCYGFKPTYGRVSRFGLIAFASSLDCIGVLGADIDSCWLALRIISGKDENDATSVYANELNDKPEIKINGKIGYLDMSEFASSLDEEVKKVYRYTVDYYKNQGIVLEPVTLNFLEYAVPCYYIICSAEAASNLSRYDGIRYGFGGDSSVTDLDEFYFQVRSNGFGREVQRRILLGNFVLSAGYQGRYYQKALKVRRKIFLNFEKLFEHYAAFLLPTSPCPPVKIDDKQDVLQEYLMDIFTVTANLCGYPAVSFPAGFTHDNLPVGMQLVAPQFHEETLYKLCKIWERENSFHKAVPPLLIQ